MEVFREILFTGFFNTFCEFVINLAFVGGEIVSFFLLLVIVDTIEALTSLVD
jgi:hypothetical protein